MRIKVGEVGVDAGLIWISDPCYVLHTDGTPKEIGNSWREFCNILHSGKSTLEDGYQQFGNCLGVCVRSGHGDGLYPVYVDIEQGIVRSVTVVFESPEGDEEEDEFY